MGGSPPLSSLFRLSLRRYDKRGCRDRQHSRRNLEWGRVGVERGLYRQGNYIPKAASVARAAVQAGRASTPAALRRVAAPPLCSAPIYTRSRRGPKVGSFSFSQRPLSGAQHGLTIPSVCPCPVDLATNLRAWQKKRSLTRPRSGRRSSGRRSELPQVYSSLTVSTRPVPRRRLQAGQPLPPRP